MRRAPNIRSMPAICNSPSQLRQSGQRKRSGSVEYEKAYPWQPYVRPALFAPAGAALMSQRGAMTARENEMEQQRRGPGRPRIFGEETRKELLGRLAEGQSLRAICRQDDMPALRTVLDWLREEPAFAAGYATAREIGADVLAAEISELSERALKEPELAHAIRVAVEAKRWLASKQAPRRYGERIEQVVVNETKTPEQIKERIAALMQELAGHFTQAPEKGEEAGGKVARTH